ncbi:hypothetical protein V497_00329 [Pseudogymnoascus sp. VKM F-4516 (FW-969)]|nr:hypothetical protein V497_00329 [Pseudogymnoascus sp. VKM F-4516 (FW-969)]
MARLAFVLLVITFLVVLYVDTLASNLPRCGQLSRTSPRSLGSSHRHRPSPSSLSTQYITFLHSLRGNGHQQVTCPERLILVGSVGTVGIVDTGYASRPAPTPDPIGFLSLPSLPYLIGWSRDSNPFARETGQTGQTETGTYLLYFLHLGHRATKYGTMVLSTMVVTSTALPKPFHLYTLPLLHSFYSGSIHCYVPYLIRSPSEILSSLSIPTVHHSISAYRQHPIETSKNSLSTTQTIPSHAILYTKTSHNTPYSERKRQVPPALGEKLSYLFRPAISCTSTTSASTEPPAAPLSACNHPPCEPGASLTAAIR